MRPVGAGLRCSPPPGNSPTPLTGTCQGGDGYIRPRLGVFMCQLRVRIAHLLRKQDATGWCRRYPGTFLRFVIAGDGLSERVALRLYPPLAARLPSSAPPVALWCRIPVPSPRPYRGISGAGLTERSAAATGTMRSPPGVPPPKCMPAGPAG